MSDERRARLTRLASEVAEGSSVDWEREMRAAGRAMSRQLRNLRVVQAIRDTHASGDDRELLRTGDVTAPALPERWGPLEIVELIDSGGFGEVYRARDPALDAEVALKLVREDRMRGDASGFLDEARRLARVRHPNVVTVHGAAEHDGRVGIWTELLEGRTLESILDRDGPMSAREAALIGIEVCRAVAAVHAAGLVHRDVKASNVMRHRGGRIVLLDFGAGVERGAGDVALGDPLTGTPFYMAPELFRREDSGPAADLYAIGVLLYRLVSARYPIDATSLDDVLRAHERGDYRRLLDVRADVPPAFARVVERALSPDPADRPATAGELESELAAFVGGSAPPVPEPPWWRRPAVWAASATGLLLLVVAAWAIRGAFERPFEVDAAWLRVRGDLVEERLRPGTAVAVGDCLVLEIEGTRPLHVYVVNEDRQGESFVLFPLASLDRTNPLTAAERHVLPGTIEGRPECWHVTSAGDEETMLVIASVDPLPPLEQELAGYPRAGGLDPVPVRAAVIDAVRGVGGLAPLPAGPDETVDPGLANRLSRRFASADGLWIWELRLANPGP